MLRELAIVAFMFVLSIAAWSLTTGVDMPEAYQFPRTVIAVMFIMAAIQMIQTLVVRGRGKTHGDRFPFADVAKALVCMLVYFAIMERVGFYTAGFLFFVIATSILQAEPVSVRTLARRSGIAGAFMAALFVLFNMILAVQTPSGILI